MRFWKKITSVLNVLRTRGLSSRQPEENEFLLLFIAEMAHVSKKK